MSQDGEEERDTVKFLVPRNIAFSENEAPGHFELGSFERSSWDEEEEANVLAPDHPLLEKFQKALKEHLQRQVEHLRNEVYDLEVGAKKKKAEREQLGIQTYEAQQIVTRQQQELELCVAELDHICYATEQAEIELEEAKNSFSQKRLEHLETEKRELHLRTEVESCNLLLHQMSQWENDVESELSVNQRIFEKTKRDKAKLTDEKRQLDMIIYKLMTETWRLEEELQTFDMQLRVKEEQREKLAETVAANNVDIETMNTEHRCLMHSWNSIIVVTSQRDRHYDDIKENLDALNKKLRTISCETEQTTKLCRKEMVQNERLSDIKCRVQADIDNCSRLFAIETKKRDQLEVQMDNNQTLMDQIEKDIQNVSAENANKSYKRSALIKEIEKLSQQKIAIENQILKTVEEQMTNNKGIQYLTKMLHDLSEKRWDTEINLAMLENTNGQVLMNTEVQKLLNAEAQRFLDEMMKQQNDMEAKIKESRIEFEKSHFEATKKQREIDILTTKIETIIKKRGGSEVSPDEVKIFTLQKTIEGAKEKIKELQEFWLRQQVHVVALTQQRQDQINDINMLKKQMMLLVQKNLKINDELEAHKKLENSMNRCIRILHKRLGVLNDELCKKRGNKDILGKDNDSIHIDYIGKLKDSEMEILKIKAEIIDIEEDKVNLSDQLIEFNREALTWERKIQMAVESKKKLDEEKGEGGEMANIKADIHRMKVRMGQLKKAQNKLIQDLEQCISRRDAIITITEAREKKEKGGSEKTRINFTRKLDDMRNTVTQMENEFETLEKQMEGVEEEEERVAEEISMTKTDIKHTKEKTSEKQEAVEQAKTLRQRNLQILVLKQKKLKVYSELSKNRRPYILYRTESVINTEYDNQKQLNNKLLDITENLLCNFPNYFQVLTRIQDTLKVPLIYLKF